MYTSHLDIMWGDHPKTVNNEFYSQIYILKVNFLVICGEK